MSKLLWTITKRLFDEIKLIFCRFYQKSSQINSKLETYKDESFDLEHVMEFLPYIDIQTE